MHRMNLFIYFEAIVGVVEKPKFMNNRKIECKGLKIVFVFNEKYSKMLFLLKTLDSCFQLATQL